MKINTSDFTILMKFRKNMWLSYDHSFIIDYHYLRDYDFLNIAWNCLGRGMICILYSEMHCVTILGKG